ncbi:MutS-related protein [Mucilaginibacter sp.]
MNFSIDKQTLDDLSIFPSANNHRSVFALFSNTKTIGAQDKLVELFKKPLTDAKELKNRIEIIGYFFNSDHNLNIEKQSCDFAEFYLKRHSPKRSFAKIISLFEKVVYSVEKIVYTLNSNNDYYVTQQGVGNTLSVLATLLDFIDKDFRASPKILQDFKKTISAIFRTEDLVFIKGLMEKPNINPFELSRADQIFKHTAKEEIMIMLDIIYQLDLYISVSNTAKSLGLSLPVIKNDGQRLLIIKRLFHPFINNPIANDVAFDRNHNLCFVTGTNMAGKSTFLKSVGVSIYLAHIGFPVLAGYMETSVFDGLITTINIDDNIDQGHSHFYSEVLRVKHVANKINESQNIFVIFDELFRGTNVKDAYDASLAIISAFAKVRKCFFMVSTHIIEVANDLKNIGNIDFRYMETVFENGNPTYTYKLKEGITEERLGMWIVRNEGIVEIIEGAIK